MSDSATDGAYFDRFVEDSGDFNPFADRGWDVLARRFADVAGQARDLRVLDIGCGTGQSRRIYARQASVYTGVDLSRGALRLARQRFGDAHWLQADGSRLPFRDGAFDVVALSSVLHHVPDMPSVLAAARRVVRPGGLVFAFDPNVRHPAMLLFRHPASPLYRANGVTPDERPLQPSVLRQAFAEGGLAEIGQRCQSGIPYRAVAPKLLNRLLPVYNVADWAWEHIGAGRWFGAFVVTWGRKPFSESS
jgi:SAM-dependent methyltransferase